MLEKIISSLKELQNSICDGLEAIDQKAKFQEDIWQRPDGGGGITRVIQNGAIIAKGGVNFSEVSGPMPKELIKTLFENENFEYKEHALKFTATGVSIVLHPNSPMSPIIHMNVRYFETSNNRWWFGGGIDLTPHYIIPELAVDFHQRLKSVCDEFGVNFYSDFKNWCDDYFYIAHREETRGIGGIFFDRMDEKSGLSKEDLLNFILKVGYVFVPAYGFQIENTKNLSFGEKELHWQSLRRSRYAEFNLVWDRGTKFGLQTAGRIESILMSMPPTARWEYNFVPEPGSEEEKTQKLLKKGIIWI